MRLAIIGLPLSGKTTIFNALTRGDQPTTTNGGRFDVHTAVIDVPDRRVEDLSGLFKPRKTTFAKVTYVDVAGLDGSNGSNGSNGNGNGKNGNGKNGLAGPLLNQLSQMDGFVHVVRCFDNPSIPHPAGSVDPARDLAVMDLELILNDLILIERKLERLDDERRKGVGRDKAQVERETALFQKLHAHLSGERPLRELELSAEEGRLLSGYGLLTRKPVLVLFNLAEGQEPPAIVLDAPHTRALALQGKLEMDLAQLPPDEAREFMDEYGIQTLGLERVIEVSYNLLGLQSFFTVGEDEVRAWTLRRGAPALEAAGAIHTDLQKGFIRAEVVPYGDLLALGSLAEARNRGKLRLEGKEYPVQDGDIVHVRFNV